MAKLTDLLPNNTNYLRAIDLPPDREFTLEIERVDVEEIESDGHPTRKPVLYFRGKHKGMVLNRTNLETIVATIGDDQDSVRGKSIILYRSTTSFRGAVVPCLRLRPVTAPATSDTPF